MPELLFVRHGESTWNAEGRWQGLADPPLSLRGETEARLAAERLSELAALDFVAASSLTRASQTASVFAEVLSLPAPETFEALRERDVGTWSGLTVDEIDVKWPGMRHSGATPPGWEDDLQLIMRVVPAIEALVARRDGLGCVVTHGGVIRALERHYGAPDAGRPIANLDGRWFAFEGITATPGGRISLLQR